MRTFKIEITEILKRVEEIESESIELAIQLITQKYISEEIVLDSSDFIEHQICEFSRETI
ncbi:MAG: DpnD/PcfM family protein [Paludibacter sp.]|nr:DpnD/PcfM family protein [Paludibacter sp.]